MGCEYISETKGKVAGADGEEGMRRQKDQAEKWQKTCVWVTLPQVRAGGFGS